MSNTNSFRQVGAGKTFLSPTDFLVQVVTSDGSAQLVLPKIATILDSYTTIYQYMGIRFVDISDNASANNIELIGFENDKINGESSITIDTNGGGGILTLIGNGQWAYTPNGSSSASSNYLFQETPFETGYPSFTQGGDVLGIVNEDGLLYNPPYVILSNGNVAQLGVVQTILGGSIYIFQAWDYQTANPNPFYWVAMKQSSTNPQKLEYICDLLWTTQYLNQFYVYIKNTSTSTDLSCTFISYTSPNTDTDPIEVYKTLLTYSNGVLTAVDSLDDFGGETFLSLFNSLTGLSALTLNMDYTEPLFSANSDFSQMLNPNGKYSGYVYYWDLNAPSSEYTNIIGYNILTGETRLVQPIVGLGSVTNFGGDINKAIVEVISHPKGCFFILADGLIVDNGLNYNGVTSIWSPDITNNTIVKYINNRNEFGEYASTNGNLDDNVVSGIAYLNAPFDNGYLYCYDSPVVIGNCTNLVAYRFAFDYADEGTYEVVSLPFNNETQSNPIQAVASFPTDNGMLMASLIVPAIEQYSYNFHWVYWNNAQINPSQLQLNAYAPTNYFGNTIFGTTINYSAVNWNSYGVTYDKYNQTF